MLQSGAANGEKRRVLLLQPVLQDGGVGLADHLAQYLHEPVLQVLGQMKIFIILVLIR